MGAADGDDATISALLEPDETADDVLRVLKSCRGTGIPCVDRLLEGGCLGPGELVVLRGETGSGKTVLLRHIVARYIAAADVGGHALPAVVVDTEGTFDLQLLARLLAVEAQVPRTGDDMETREVQATVQEGLSRLLVLRPRDPFELLRQLLQLRDVLAANPAASLVAVDSMSAWQPLAAAFPRAAGAALREAWQALWRLQRERCVAVVVTQRDGDFAGGSAASGLHADRRRQPAGPGSTAVIAASCRHLGLERCKPPATAQAGASNAEPACFAVSLVGAAPGSGSSASGLALAAAGERAPRGLFRLGASGEVVRAA